MKNNKIKHRFIRQIDLTPNEENGLYVVREEYITRSINANDEIVAESIIEVDTHTFAHEAIADKWIENWIASNS